MKAPEKPLFGIEERLKVLQSLKSIDHVIAIFSPQKVINEINLMFILKQGLGNSKDISGNLKKETKV